jgi:ribosomal protein S18 acetylase RimI-like enzyme
VPHRVEIVRARDADATVGYALADHDPDAPVYVDELVVDSACRGEGIGELVLREVARRALNEGADTIALRPIRDADLERREAWFTSFGFRPRDDRDIWEADARSVAEGRL